MADYYEKLTLKNIYLTPNCNDTISTESYELNVQITKSAFSDGISVVQDQSFSRY